MRCRSLLLVLPLLSLAARPAHAQTAPDSAADADVRARLKSDLRSLVVAQEAYYADHSAYADVMTNLNYKPSGTSQVSLVATQNNAWAAVATDPARPGKSCVIFINLAEKYRPKTLAEKRVGATSDEGRALCDGDPKPGM